MTFLHMHHVMANKALMVINTEAKSDDEFWHPNMNRLREIVMSGEVDYRGELVTDADRQIVLNYLNA